MIEDVGFGVSQTVEYGYYLETAHDGRHAVCERAVNHCKPDFDDFLKGINAHPPKGDLKEWYAGVKAEAIKTAKGMAGIAETWARENHSYGANATFEVEVTNKKGKTEKRTYKRGWDNVSTDAEKGLTGYTVIDGVRKPI
jgi:hypothetical protein